MYQICHCIERIVATRNCSVSSTRQCIRNGPVQNAEGNSPDLFNPRVSDEASGRGR